MHVLRPTLLAMAICALCACSPSPTEPETTASAAPPPMEPVAAPVIGIDIAGMDTAVKPGDDFEAYANGGWRETTEIPADRASTGIFLQVFEKAEKRTADLVQAIIDSDPQPGSDERRIADYYTAFMDTATIEQRGLEPLQPQLDAIGAIDDRTALAKYLGDHLRADVDPLNATDLSTPNLFGLFVTQGLQDPAHNLPYLLQGGLGMPSRDYYLSDEAAMKDIRGKYQDYVAALLEQAGIDDADAMAKRVYGLEEKIAKAQATIIETQDAHNAETWKMDAFAKQAPGLDWATYFQAAGLQDQDTFIAWQPEAITRLSALVASAPLEDWKAWATFHALDDAAPLLPKAFADLSFGFYGTALSGTPQQRARDKRALAAVGNSLGDAIGQRYVQKYFPASSREKVQQLVSNLLEVFPERIDKLDWMSDETKAMAKKKVSTMQVSVGYPDTWRDYSSLEIKPDDALGNAQRAELAEYRHQRA
jgi:putative endopeptidase